MSATKPTARVLTAEVLVREFAGGFDPGLNMTVVAGHLPELGAYEVRVDAGQRFVILQRRGHAPRVVDVLDLVRAIAGAQAEPERRSV